MKIPMDKSKKCSEPNIAFRLISIFILSLVLAACKSDSPKHDFSHTATKKRTINQEVIHFLLNAEQAFNQQVFNTALILADSAAQYAPDLADIYFLRGRTFTKLRQLDKAKESYKKVIFLNPKYT